MSPQTLRNYGVAVRDFLAFTGPPEAPRLSVQNLTPEDPEAYVIHTRERLRHDGKQAGLTLGSVATYLYGALPRADLGGRASREPGPGGARAAGPHALPCPQTRASPR
ncbi:hypothetical protein ERJ73_02190, partial [Deinococcus metallilatus]